MSRVSPTLEGFRAAFRTLALTFAEIAWRWAVGATATALFLFTFFEYLNTLPVSRGDSALLWTRQPALIGRALSHIFRGSLNRVVLAGLLVALSLSVLWIIVASIGRAATVRALLDYFHEDAASKIGERESSTETRPVGPLTNLNFLRVAVGLAAILAVVGAGILASFASSDLHPHPGLVFVLFLPLAALIGLAAWALNWWLSLAGIFTVRDGEDALGALSAAISLFRERPGAVVSVSIWTGLAHFVAFSMASTAAGLPLGLIQIAPSRAVLAGIILVTLAYFAVVDWLYIARLAGYVCVAEMPHAAFEPSPPVLPPSPVGTVAPSATTIDRDELILSDIPSVIPNLALET
jgi:hypothetical protein